MSFSKRALFSGERDGEPLVQIIRPGESIKTASHMLPSVREFIDALKPDPRYTYVLVNAMGYSEFYGSNSNTDWYGYNPHLDFNGLLHAPPDFGQDQATDKMHGVAWPYGFPSYYGATVYAHHKNTDPQQLGFGDVVFVAPNPVMKRIELVERVFNEEARKKGHTSILSRIAAGERVDVSMGCKVPFDLCSICTDWAEVKRAWSTFNPELHKHPGITILAYHKHVKPIRGLAVTKVDYCEHMVRQRGQIFPDGRKVFVYNDFPRFFDISYVWVGADRTARVMWSMGEAPAPTTRRTTSDAGDIARILEQILAKTSSVKLSAMEKEIPDGIAEAVQLDADTAPDLSGTFEVLVGGSKEQPTDAVKTLLSTLVALGIFPTPKEFQTLALHNVVGGQLIKRALDEKNVIFDTSVGGVDDTFSALPGLFDSKLASALRHLMAERSSFAPFLHARMMDPEPKTASSRPHVIRTPLLNKIAAQYNGLRLSMLENAPELFPKTGALLGPEIYLQEGGKGIGLAALLLGLAPVISLVSSHLRSRRDEGQQLGAMAQFVADQPSFVAMTTIGVGLRAAMAVDKAGGLVQAARQVVSAAREVL